MKKGQKMSQEQKQKISKSNRETYKKRDKPHYQAFGQDNPACRSEVREKISNTIKILWETGRYKNRVNGMKGKTKFLHPMYNPTTKMKYKFNAYLSQFQNVKICSRCNKQNIKIDIHHIDENHNNWTITNLEPLCVLCHRKFHNKCFIQPYVTIGKQFTFESCHQLFFYEGKCSRQHGHSYHLEVQIKKRIDPETGMVMDFSNLKNIVNKYVIDKVDHFNLNNIMQFQTTAENMLFWIWKQLEMQGLLKGLNKILLWETETSVASITYKDILEYETKLLYKK